MLLRTTACRFTLTAPGRLDQPASDLCVGRPWPCRRGAEEDPCSREEEEEDEEEAEEAREVKVWTHTPTL